MFATFSGVQIIEGWCVKGDVTLMSQLIILLSSLKCSAFWSVFVPTWLVASKLSKNAHEIMVHLKYYAEMPTNPKGVSSLWDFWVQCIFLTKCALSSVHYLSIRFTWVASKCAQTYNKYAYKKCLQTSDCHLPKESLDSNGKTFSCDFLYFSPQRIRH